MENKNNIGMGHEVTAPNSNYKFYVSGVEEFSSIYEGINFIKDNNHAMCVRGHEGIRIGLHRHEGVYSIRLFNIINGGRTASHDYEFEIGQRMVKSAVEKIAERIYRFIGEIEAYEEEEETEVDVFVISEIVARYQAEWDGYVDDLKAIAHRYHSITYGIDYLKVAKIIAKMHKLGEDLLTAIGDETNCDMVEEDGYWFDTKEFEAWMENAYGDYYLHLSDLMEMYSDTMYMAVCEDRVAPMSEEEFKRLIDVHFMFDEWDEEIGVEGNWEFAVVKYIEDYVPTEDELDYMGCGREYDYFFLPHEFAERVIKCFIQE